MTWRVDSAPGWTGGKAGRAHARRDAVRLVPAGLAIAVLAAFPALAAPTGLPAKTAKQRFTLQTAVPSFQPPVTDPGKFSFTAPNSAAAARMQTVERAFQFTPSGQTENRKSLSLGVATRVVASAAPDRSKAGVPTDSGLAAPAAYNVDVSLAWKGFALNTGYSHSEPNPLLPLALGNRLTDAVNVGFSYGGRNWRTRVQGTAEQGPTLLFAPLERRYSLELGGAYLVAPRLSVTGGVRYRLNPETPTLLDPNRDDQAVFVGTNFAF